MKNSQSDTLFKVALRQCHSGFGALVLFSLGVNLLALVTPIYMMQLFDRVLTSQNTDTMIMLFALAMGGLMAMSLLDSFRTILMSRIGAWIDRVLGAPVLSETIARVSKTRMTAAQPLRDLSVVRGFLSGPAILPFIDAFWVPVFLIFLFLLHSSIGTLATIGGILLFAIAVLNEKLTREQFASASSASLKGQNWADGAVRNSDVIQAMGMSENILKRWQEHYYQAQDLQSAVGGKNTILTSLSKFLRMALQIGVLTLGAYLAIQGEMTGGAMIAASMVMGKALSPVEQSISAWKSLIAARTAYDRLKPLMDEISQSDPATPLPTPKGALDVEALTYTPKLGEDPVLKLLSFSLEPGESLGLIGPTASGKTTLAKLLVGSLEATDGHVRLDGMDVNAWRATDRGRHFGYLPQNVELFEGTIAQNIMRLQEGDLDQMYQAAQLAGVHDMIMRLPQGYDTHVGERGDGLSGGQRQRIGLARALYGQPRFVVLDEPNANLDSDGEDALDAALSRLKAQGVTVVVIAHRPSAVQSLDKILVLKDGQIQRFGPRHEVIQNMNAHSDTPNRHKVNQQDYPKALHLKAAR